MRKKLGKKIHVCCYLGEGSVKKAVVVVVEEATFFALNGILLAIKKRERERSSHLV